MEFQPHTSPPEVAVLSVAQFCASYGISKPVLYRLWDTGTGPASFKLGSRRLIARTAADQWLQQIQARSA